VRCCDENSEFRIPNSEFDKLLTLPSRQNKTPGATEIAPGALSVPTVAAATSLSRL
jgi:hypothetical protein